RRFRPQPLEQRTSGPGPDTAALVAAPAGGRADEDQGGAHGYRLVELFTQRRQERGHGLGLPDHPLPLPLGVGSGPAGMPLRSYHPHRARGHDQVVDRRAARRQGALVEDDDFGTGDPGQPPPEPDLAASGSIGGAPVTALGPARGFAEDVVGVDGGALETLDLPVDDG